MIHETYRNVLFGAASVLMLLATIKHSEYITSNIDISEEYYSGLSFAVLVTCLFVNICLGIFSLFILGNLNDFIERMSVNLIGAYQKIRVLAILMVLSTIFYLASNLICFFKAYVLTSLEKKMVMISSAVVIFQLFHVFSAYLIHPDLFGFGWRKEVNMYDQGGYSRNVFV